MITNDQLDVLRNMHDFSTRCAQRHSYKPVCDAYKAEADALAAAIATIERLPCDDNGVRLLPGPDVRLLMRAAAKGAR